MRNLVNITEKDGQQVVNARELHQFLNIGKDFSNWIKGRIKEYQFIEGQDFEVFAKIGENPQGGRPSKDYGITLDMAKELSMVERNKKGRQARRYFIEMEKHARQQFLSIPAPIDVNEHLCLDYTHWLLGNGYSVSSGSYHRRIKNYPQHFHKHEGRWYISEDFANALVKAREARRQLERVEPLSQMALFVPKLTKKLR